MEPPEPVTFSVMAVPSDRYSVVPPYYQDRTGDNGGRVKLTRGQTAPRASARLANNLHLSNRPREPARILGFWWPTSRNEIDGGFRCGKSDTRGCRRRARTWIANWVR